MSASSAHVGKRVRVTTAGVAGIPETLEADMFAIDGARGLAVLRRVHAHTYQKADYFFIPIAALITIEILGDTNKPTVMRVQPSDVEKRLHDAILAEKRRLSRKNAGVSDQSQRVFDELLKQ